MLLWFIATAVVTIHFVFGDPRFDYRWLVLGATAPVIADLLGGWTSLMSSVVFGVTVLVAVMAATVGRRDRRRRALGLPIGVLLHMVFGGAWNTNGIFWWPFAGTDLGGAPSLAAERLPVGVVLEVVGLLGCWWIVRRNGLVRRDLRRRFFETGRLEFQ